MVNNLYFYAPIQALLLAYSVKLDRTSAALVIFVRTLTPAEAAK
jgi:hypothetical protein